MPEDFYPLRKIFTKKIVLITGMHNTGKSMLCPLVSSLKGCENLRKDFLIEDIQTLFHYGKISKDAAMYMLGSKIDFMFYDNLIGRNINMRFGDETSLWNASDPVNLFRRLGGKKSDNNIDIDVDKNDTFFLLDLHNGVLHSQLWLDCFPNIKIINIQRHPIDVINSWYKKGLGDDIWKNKNNQLLTLKWKNEYVPYYAYGWEDLYVKSSPIERVILMCDNLMNKHYDSIIDMNYKNKENILNLHFDNVAVNPSKNIKEICNFIQTSETIQTSINKEQERVPRELKLTERDKKFNSFKKIVSHKFIEIINIQSARYDSKHLTLEL